MDRRTLLTGMAGLGVVALTGCGSSSSSKTTATASPTTTPTTTPTPTATTPTPIQPKIADTIATGLDVPWGVAFMGSGDALVGLRNSGRIIRISPTGQVTTITDVAGVVAPTGEGEGGLLGITFPPKDESALYAYITTASDNRVVKMSFDGATLGTPKPILTGIPTSTHHHGGRLLFDPQGHLFVSVGDAEQSALAQDKTSLAGKILRIDTNGKAASGNPFGNRTWTYGHRNVEGMAFDAQGRLWATEFGDKTADELNLIVKGKNYGWPHVEGKSSNPAYENPKVTWSPTSTCSPAGLAIIDSTAFIGALQGECLFAVELDGATAGKPKKYFAGEHGRIRGVTVTPDGDLWISTSNRDGRATPKSGDDHIFQVTI